MSPYHRFFLVTAGSLLNKAGRFVFAILALLAAVQLQAQTIPPYFTGFEPAQGFSLGDLNGQQGWQVTQGTANVTDTLSVSPGSQSVAFSSGSNPVSIVHLFGQQSGANITYVELFARPVVSSLQEQSTVAKIESSELGFFRLGAGGIVFAFDGDGSGSGRWVVTSAVLPLDSNGQASGWHRFTIRQNYTTKKWDLYHEGSLIACDLGFRDNGKSFFSRLVLTSALSPNSYVDDIYVGDSNPMFVDADNDGMSDSWEAAKGLNTAVNDRDLDADSDGLTNVEEYLLGTNPNQIDTDQDGLPDGWEFANGTDPLTNDASSDPGGVGRTLLESFQQAMSPWPTPTVAGGLRAWYRADKGVVKDANNKVSQWTDVSGHGFHVVQVNEASRQPLFVNSAFNGHPVVQYDNWLKALLSSGPVDISAGADDATIIAVVKPEATANYASTIFAWGTDGNYTLGVSGPRGAANVFSMIWRDDSGMTKLSPDINAPANQVQVLAMVKDGVMASSYLNGAMQGTVTVPAGMDLLLAPIAVGNAAYPYYAFNGQIAEILVYNRALSAAERGQIEAALKTKYINPDSDADGLPDVWEDRYVGTRNYGASSDPGGVGRTLLESYQQSLNPWPAPTVESGLRAWYRADRGIVKDGSDNVSQWTDVSGHGFHVVQVNNTSRQPLYVSSAFNGQPVVQYDDWLKALVTPGPVDFSDGADDITVIAVVKPDAVANYGSSIFAWGTDGNYTLGLSGPQGSSNAFSMIWRDDAGATRLAPAVNAPAGQVQVLSAVKQGVLASSYLNGNLQGSVNVPAGMDMLAAPVAVGNAAYPYYAFHGQIAEVLVYNRALSAAERGQIEAALKTKYIHPDSDADGLPDAWEDQYVGTRSYTAASDPGGVGRTLLQSYQQGLNPWPAPIVGSGLRAWYRADQGVVKDSNDKVSQWTDLSGHGFHVEQVNDANRKPLFVSSAFNGQPVVQYNDWLKALVSPGPVDFSGGANDITVIAVVKPEAAANYASTIFAWGTDGNYTLGVSGPRGAANAFSMIWRDDSGMTQLSPEVNAPADQVQVLAMVKDGVVASSYLDGSMQGTGLVPAQMAMLPAKVAVGNAAYPYYAFNGQIAEVLVYNRALSAAERGQIEAALKTKYINPDSDADGLPDTWEDQYLGTRSYDGTSDPGGVGRTLLQSYQQSLNPWPAPTVGSGLRAWYRADRGIVKDVNDKVSQWTDVSGHGFHVVQVNNTSRQPLYVGSAFNGQPVVQYDDWLKALVSPGPVDFAGGANDITVIAVVKPEATANYGSTIFAWGTDGNYTLGLSGPQGASNAFSMIWRDAAGATKLSPVVNAPADQVQVLTAVKGGSFASSYLDGVLQGSVNVPAGMDMLLAPIAVGNAAYPYYAFHGQIAEVLVYNRALSTTERESIEAALKAKYIESANPDGDDDGDGLTNATEITLGTDPKNADTDGDGVQDGLEVSLGMNPLVADADTLPTKISGLRLFLRANAGVTADGNGKISAWSDQSAYGNHATQATAGNRPTLIANALNGMPAARFNGSSAFLDLPHFLSGLTSAELFVVVKGSATSGSVLFSYMGSSGQTTYPSGANQISDGFGSNSTRTFSTGGTDIALPRLYNVSAAANAWSASLDGNVVYTSGTNTVNFANAILPPLIGAARGGAYYAKSNWFNGDVAEIIIYDHALSLSDRQTVAGYLTHKYSLSIPAPEPPSGLTAVSISATKVSLSWLGSGAATYTLERSSSGSSWQTIATLSGNTSFTDSGLVGATTYSYRIKASNYAGSTGYVGPVSATTQIANVTSELPVTGMKLWLRPEELVQSSGGLSKWTDISGAASHATQDTSANRPQVVAGALNGQPAVRFNGTSGYLNLPNFLNGLASAELFVVLKGSTTSGSVLFSYMGSSPQTTYPSGANQISDGFGSNTPRVFGTNGVDLSQLHLYNVSANASAWSASLNANVAFSSPTNAVNFTNGLFNPYIGAARGGSYYAFSNWFSGDVAEIIVYDRVLTSLEREAVHFYLNRRYAFSPRSFTDESGFNYDSDGDGLSNAEEQALGTNPYRRDTDGDGMPDDWEIAHGLNPLDATDGLLDADGDGVNNLAEYYAGTNPLVPVANDAGASVKLKVFQPGNR
jgi:phage tail tube protein FII